MTFAVTHVGVVLFRQRPDEEDKDSREHAGGAVPTFGLQLDSRRHNKHVVHHRKLLDLTQARIVLATM